MKYARLINGKTVQVARVKLLGIGKFAFETSLFGEKPYELNMNMPMFDTEKKANEWIGKLDNWVSVA